MVGWSTTTTGLRPSLPHDGSGNSRQSGFADRFGRTGDRASARTPAPPRLHEAETRTRTNDWGRNDRSSNTRARRRSSCSTCSIRRRCSNCRTTESLRNRKETGPVAVGTSSCASTIEGARRIRSGRRGAESRYTVGKYVPGVVRGGGPLHTRSCRSVGRTALPGLGPPARSAPRQGLCSPTGLDAGASSDTHTRSSWGKAPAPSSGETG